MSRQLRIRIGRWKRKSVSLLFNRLQTLALPVLASSTTRARSGLLQLRHA
jgi:hypothetical protein